MSGNHVSKNIAEINNINSSFREFEIVRGTRSPRFKKFGKIWLGSKLSLGLIYGLSFRIQDGPSSLSRAEHLAAVSLVTQAVVRVGLKIGY